MPLDEYRREMLHGNGDHSANVTRSEKLEEMQGSIVRRRMPTKLIKPAMLFMRLKRWLQRSDKKIGDENAKVDVRNDTPRQDQERTLTRDNKSGACFSEDYWGNVELVRARDEERWRAPTLRKLFRTNIPGKRKRGRTKLWWKWCNPTRLGKLLDWERARWWTGRRRETQGEWWGRRANCKDLAWLADSEFHGDDLSTISWHIDTTAASMRHKK